VEAVKPQVRIAADGKQVTVTGTCLEAKCDHIIWTEANDRAVLDGHVRLKYHKGGVEADIIAEQVVVGLTDGYLEVKSAPAAVPGVVSHPACFEGFCPNVGFIY
jgi:hypothetical protein